MDIPRQIKFVQIFEADDGQTYRIHHEMNHESPEIHLFHNVDQGSPVGYRATLVDPNTLELTIADELCDGGEVELTLYAIY